MRDAISNFAKDDSGATAIEYALVATLISIALILGATWLGSQLNTRFTGIGNSVKG